MSNIKIKGISNEIAKILAEYSDEVSQGISIAKEEIAIETAIELRNTSPKKKGKGGGRYAKGWRVTSVYGKQIVHNKTDYRLTHLLEYGHAKVNGGRVAAKAHIRPAEEKAIKEYIERVEKAVKV